MRALAALYERNTASTDLRDYIKQYIGVQVSPHLINFPLDITSFCWKQYNAVLDHATSGGSNIYALPWTGPPISAFSPNAQTVALTALISSIQLIDNQASSTKRNLAGIIAGSVLGVIGLIATLITGGIFLRKRQRRRNADGTFVLDESPFPVLTPFVITRSMAASWISEERHRRNQIKSTQSPGVANRGEPSSLGVVDNDGAAGTARENIQTELTPPREAWVSGAVNTPPRDGRENALIEELLILLNERLLPDRRNAGELPPDYHE